jgi:outer membrane protein TolC
MIKPKSSGQNIIFLWLKVLFVLHFTNKVPAQPRILHLSDFLSEVIKHHPMSLRADLRQEMAISNYLKSKGTLDPTLGANVEQKYFSDKNYYSLLGGELKIPTILGLDLKTGYSLNRGVFLNPENKVPDNGLIYGGISLPLGQGLLIDDRRALIKDAKIGLESGNLEKLEIKNDLLFNATQQYWEWFRAYAIFKILEDSEKIAVKRIEAVKNYVSNGDRPAIDTVEAGIQVQNIRLALMGASLDLKKNQNSLLSYIWNEGGILNQAMTDVAPLEMESELKKMLTDYSPSVAMLDIKSQPYLLQLRNKLLQQEIDIRLKRDKLKPKVNLQYTPITEALGNKIITDYNINNYKWGVEFKMPLYLRKERGEFQLSNLKLKETELLLSQKTVEIETKIENYIIDWRNTSEQIDIYSETVQLYRQLLDAEKKLFDTGESSLFLINTREQAYIQANIKLVELLVKNRISYFTIWYLAGQMQNTLNIGE